MCGLLDAFPMLGYYGLNVAILLDCLSYCLHESILPKLWPETTNRVAFFILPFIVGQLVSVSVCVCGWVGHTIIMLSFLWSSATETHQLHFGFCGLSWETGTEM